MAGLQLLKDAAMLTTSLEAAPSRFVAAFVLGLVCLSTASSQACLAKGAGFLKLVTAENSAACPNAAQYYGKLVNGVERNVVIGACRFPQDHAITDVEQAAKVASSSGPFSLDAILFGKWRD
jgi:hypothetical protein